MYQTTGYKEIATLITVYIMETMTYDILYAAQKNARILKYSK